MYIVIVNNNIKICNFKKIGRLLSIFYSEVLKVKPKIPELSKDDNQSEFVKQFGCGKIIIDFKNEKIKQSVHNFRTANETKQFTTTNDDSNFLKLKIKFSILLLIICYLCSV